MFSPQDIAVELGAACQKVAADAHFRSLNLLRAVDDVVDELARSQREKEEMLSRLECAIEFFQKNASPAEVLGELLECLEQAESANREYISHLEGGRASAFQLNGHLESAVVIEFDRALTLSKQLHNTVVALRWTLVHKSAASEPRSEVSFKSTAELRESLETDLD